jgi:leucyl aminopeptidase (aminopeptidase T)
MFAKSADIVLKKCMGIRKDEKVLIITDKNLQKIGNAFYSSLKKIASADLVKIKIPKAHGTEPEKNIAEKMLEYDVILMPTTKSLSHTNARKNASSCGARIASMPGITIGLLKALDVDYNGIDKIGNELIENLKKTKTLRIITKKGTDISFSVKNKKWQNDNGIYTKKTAFGNLPAGEVCTAPVEGTANGTLVIDASIGGIGKVDREVIIKIKNGFADEIIGKKSAIRLKKLLLNEKYKNIAEIGIGTNKKAKISGIVLGDEKVFGTIHIALGNNLSYGGKVDVPFHVDCVIKNPTVFCDNKKIMEKGAFCL